ncbi:hypothetical protein MPSEU_001090900 [Mayamaea pseudoterrestris]|nr:hypothetical protein MPSEU_001090900 [Mayamaea pseudoterrestris]
MVTTRNQEKHDEAEPPSNKNEESSTEPSTLKRDKDEAVNADKKLGANRSSHSDHTSKQNRDESGDDEGREDIKQGAAKRESSTSPTAGHDSDDNEKDSDAEISINRAPVLTLWVSVVAERLGYSRDEAYSYGRWVASTLAASKGRALGIVRPSKKKKTDAEGRREGREMDADHIMVFGQMKIPVKDVNGKLLAVKQGKTINPETVRRYFHNKFGDNLDHAHDAMMKLAESMEADDLRNRAYEFYEQFRPEWHGWGRKGTLDLDEIEHLAEEDE